MQLCQVLAPQTGASIALHHQTALSLSGALSRACMKADMEHFRSRTNTVRAGKAQCALLLAQLMVISG